MRNRHAIIALSLAALVCAGCSKEEPNKNDMLSRASDYFAANQYDKAEKEYRDVLRLDSNDPVALRQLGLLYQAQGQVLLAYPLLKKSSELEPDNLEVQLQLGFDYLASRENTKARDVALKILEKQPGHEQALSLLADSAISPKDIEETQKLIEGLREKDRDRAGYHLALGSLALRQKNDAGAESQFKAAINLDPKSSALYVALGTLYWSRNDLNAAEQAFKTAADLAPPQSPMRLRYADFKLKTGAAAEAKTILEDITKKVPSYLPPQVFLMRMACAENQAQTDDCVARVQNILAQDSVQYDALFQDGIQSLAKGDAAKAIRNYEYLSNTYGENPQVRYQLALAYLLYAKTANAVESRKAVENAENRLMKR